VNTICTLRKYHVMEVLPFNCRWKPSCIYLLILHLLFQNIHVNAGQPYYHKGTDNRYYKFHDEHMHREDAEKRCEEEEAHLVVLRSPSTLAYVKDTFRYVLNGIWAGAQWVEGANGTGHWEWDDMTMVANESWAGGAGVPFRNVSDPDYVRKDCAMINFNDVVGGHLHAVDCSWKEPRFLCQKDHRSCVYESGACVTSENRAVNSTLLLDDVTDISTCLDTCLQQGDNVTGCWVVESPATSTSPCHVTFDKKVRKGDEGELGTCWIIKKCEGTGPLPPPLPVSPKDYIEHTEFASFKLYKYGATYNEAKLKCHEDGAQLVIDNSDKVHQFILDTYPGLVYWLGVNDLEQKGIWKYEDSTRLVKKTFWDHGTRRHRCAMMWHNGRWRDADCTRKNFFLCERNRMLVKNAFKGEGGNNVLLPVIIVGVIAGLVLIVGIAYAQLKSRRNNEGVPNTSADGAATAPVKPADLKGGQPVQPGEGQQDNSAAYHNEGADHEEVRDEPIVKYHPTADVATIEEGKI